MTTFAHIATARIILFILSALILHAVPTQACTSALVGRNHSASGKMLLWKHRDTSSVQNFIARGRTSRVRLRSPFQRRRLHPVRSMGRRQPGRLCRNEHRQLQPRPGHRRPARPREPDRDPRPRIMRHDRRLRKYARHTAAAARSAGQLRSHGPHRPRRILQRPTTTDTANSPHSRLTAHTHQFLLLRTVRSRTRTRALRRGHNPYRPPMRHHPTLLTDTVSCSFHPTAAATPT